MPTSRKNQKSPKQKLLESSLRFLSHRPRSRSELTTYLERKTSDSDLIDQVLHELDELGFINDQKFAGWLIRSRLKHNQKGSIFLKYKLRRFGIGRDLISTSIADIDDSTWIQAARDLLAKKRLLPTPKPTYQQKAKAYNYLKSRGFESSTITRAIDEKDY